MLNLEKKFFLKFFFILKYCLADLRVTYICSRGSTVDNWASMRAQTRFVAKTQQHVLTGNVLYKAMYFTKRTDQHHAS